MRRRSGRRLEVAVAAALALLSGAGTVHAQGRGERRRPPPSQPDEPKQAPSSDEDDERGPPMRVEPAIAPPQDPLAVSPELSAKLGTDWTSGPPAPEGILHHTQWFPYYEERRGDYRLRLLPPLFVEQTRGLTDPSQIRYGVPQTPDTQGLYGLIYYRRRSLALDMDVVFPAFWRVRDGENHVLVAGPLLHREAPNENDNWLAPLYFQGSRADGGYFHSPLLLTTSHWNAQGAFTLAGLYFRSRTGSDVDMGVAPFVFHGDTGSVEGNRRSYTLIPPALFYHEAHELDSSTMTVVGPVIARSNPKRDVLDVAPLFFHIHGKPESGGVSEEHTTLLPFFHYGHDPDTSLFVLPGYYRRVTKTNDTLLSLVYSRVEGRGGATSLTAVGPVLPIWWSYTDRDLDAHAWAIAPLAYVYSGPTGHDWLTPLVGRFQRYGQSTTWWAFPTLVASTDTHGWETDFHPIVYTGRTDDTSHTVVAPIYWDFANPKSRTTVGFPIFWRFADGGDVVQVAANTLYMQKPVAGGLDWQFHLLPLFSYGRHPDGYFWNVLFGLAGYSRDGASAEVRALWIPIHVGGGAPPPSHTALAE
jgi:hypothetical protein